MEEKLEHKATIVCSLCNQAARGTLDKKKKKKTVAAETTAYQNGTKMLDLPCDLISSILSRLPLKSLLRCRIVSKSWDSLTRNPQFIDLYHQKQKRLFLHPSFPRYRGLTNLFLYQEEDGEKPIRIPLSPDLQGVSNRVKYSCNGFLLVSIGEPRYNYLGHFPFVEAPKRREPPTYVIYNPITNETINNIPRPPEGAPLEVSFGFDSKTQTYKLIVEFKYIITHGETSWRELLGPYDKDKEMGGATRYSVFFKGTFYWTHCDKHFVIALDICNEKYTTISYPPLHETMSDCAEYNLVECDNKLALVAFDRPLQRVQVWNLGEEGETWISYFICNISDLLSKFYCKQHKFRVVKNVGNDSLQLFHIDADVNVEFDDNEDFFGLDTVWWKRIIIYMPNSEGGRVLNFSTHSRESRAKFRLHSFVPNLASFQGSKGSS